MLVFLVVRQPGFNGNSEFIRRFCFEVTRMLACHLSEDGDIPSKDRQSMLCGFDERKAKALSVGCCDEAGARSVNFFQILVTDALEPEKAMVKLGMRAKFFTHIVNHPPLLSNDNQIYIDTTPP